MATNVLKAGHQLTVFDARAEATAPLEKLGARRAPDLVAIAAAVEVTLTSLPNDAIVEEVLFGSVGTLGLIAGGRAGQVVFDLSTVSPDTTRRLAVRAADRGSAIDAPVSGSVTGAVAGTFAVMIGASALDVAPYESVLRAIKNLFFLGDWPGQHLKLLNNSWRSPKAAPL
jgi:3-hydroxyisobutyrate dehydrogenase